MARLLLRQHGASMYKAMWEPLFRLSCLLEIMRMEEKKQVEVILIILLNACQIE